ncbi:MAG: emp24/gp25L/p24 family protein [Thermoplasmata archaeon]
MEDKKGKENSTEEKKHSEKELERLLKRLKMDLNAPKFPLGFAVILIIGITLLLAYFYVLPILEAADESKEAMEEWMDRELIYDDDVTIESGDSWQVTIEGISKGDKLYINFEVQDNNAPLDSDSGMVDYAFGFGSAIIKQAENSEGDDFEYKAEENGDYVIRFTNEDKDPIFVPGSKTSDTLHLSIFVSQAKSSSPTQDVAGSLGIQGICLLPIAAFLIIGFLGMGIWIFQRIRTANRGNE